MKKLVPILFALAVLSITFALPIEAQGIDIYMTTNKVQYAPGEQGTISIVIRNTGDDPVEIRNVSIQFSNWMTYTMDGWDELGNQTVVYSPAINVPSKTGKVKLDDISFTVPTDGRATSTYVHIYIWTNKPTPIHEQEYISVFDAYAQRYIGALDNMVLLLALVAILVIVGAVAVAAAIYFGGRKPGVAWQKEG